MRIVDPIPYAIPVFVLAIVFEIIWTQLKRRHQYRVKDTFTCLTTSVMSSLVGAIGSGIIAFFYVYCFHHFRITEMSAYSEGWQLSCLLLLVVLQDFAYYWFHRLAHRINFLWASHITHHSSEEFNLAVALRQSSFQQFFSWPLYLPLAFAGFPPEWLVGVHGMNLIYQFWFHTREVDQLPAWFESIFNTPSHHRVHHGTNPQYLDKNYGGIFIIWDKLFGTFEPEVEEVRYGITVPLMSYNPIWVNVHHYWTLFKTSMIAPDVYQAILLWLAPPDWKPEWIVANQADMLSPQIDRQEA